MDLSGRGVYVITNGPRDDLIDAVTAAIRGGAKVVQYRDKSGDDTRRLDEARRLAAVCASHRVPLLVNDDLELACLSGADGVHLGRDDSDIAVARARLGRSAIIGASCYASIERARQLAAAGADYLAFGAFFASPTKPHAQRAKPALLRVARSLGLPLVAIGGVTADNAHPLIEAGADFVAVISAVFDADDVETATRRIAALFP